MRPIDPLDIKFIRRKKMMIKTQLLNKTLNAKVENITAEIEEYYEYTLEKGKYGSGGKELRVLKQCLLHLLVL